MLPFNLVVKGTSNDLDNIKIEEGQRRSRRRRRSTLSRSGTSNRSREN